jgi:hypothetical protein
MKPATAPLRGWECAYSVDAIARRESCELYIDDFDEEIGWVDLPRLFNYGFNQGYRRVLVREADGGKHLLWYISGLRDIEASSNAAKENETDNTTEDDADDE